MSRFLNVAVLEWRLIPLLLFLLASYGWVRGEMVICLGLDE